MTMKKIDTIKLSNASSMGENKTMKFASAEASSELEIPPDNGESSSSTCPVTTLDTPTQSL